MPRPRRPRRIYGPPRYTHFKPVGVPRRFLGTVTLTVDEYEAIRLADYEGLDQQPASEHMNISRPTFSRLVDGARRKLAAVLIEGKELRIEGGEVDFAHTLQLCRDCGDEELRDVSSSREEAQDEETCPVCGSDNIEDLGRTVMRGRGRGRGGADGGERRGKQGHGHRQKPNLRGGNGGRSRQ